MRKPQVARSAELGFVLVSVLFLVSFAFRVRNRSHMEAIDRS